MKLFKVFFTLFALVILLFVVSRFFPHTYKVERNIKINRPVTEVYDFMKDFRNWEKWSLWNKQTDSTLIYFYSKSSNDRQYFYGKALGDGRFKFDTCITNSKLVYDLYMHAGEVKANGTFIFKGDDAETTLIWLDSGDVGSNPVFRFMIPSKVSSTEKTFDDGLARIKEVIEEVHSQKSTVN